ncbi:SDR family oxidoreductase [Rothia terrae]|uniref:SDR family oxidoreductase n=1 Tax=Rothia terrae TaxID=396015 RepID=A0A7H2BB79_9MICC|nr:SDR family oxidoreductase [Rothia terrae]MDT0188758.1 SDR family oxidoreductase [Rothia terrae]QNV36925.1 SDR family oxidoreductase [Rothia terrae]
MTELSGKTIIITGSSRGVGADTAQILAESGANIIVNYRSKAPRANKVVAAIEEAGGKATAVGGDVTNPEDVQNLISTAIDTYGSLDYLILNASGGMETNMGEDYAMRLNRDAQLNFARAAAERMSEGGRIVFVTSHQAHFIHDVETMPEYKPVAESKKAGEEALLAEIPALKEKGISLVVVSADMIEGTVTATLLNRLRPGALDERREAAGKLYTVNEFAHEVAKMVTADVETGHIELVGGAKGFID